MNLKRYSAEELQFLRDNYRKLSAREIADILKRTLGGIYKKAYQIGIDGDRGDNRIIWTEQELQFLKDNFQTLTSYQLAAALGKKRTIVRMKYAELGLAKMKLEYWTAEMVEFLKANYQIIGDVELAEIFQQRFPKQKPWRKQHINKKRKQLDLHRTVKEYSAIASKHSQPGGRSYTILQNTIAQYPAELKEVIKLTNKLNRKTNEKQATGS